LVANTDYPQHATPLIKSVLSEHGANWSPKRANDCRCVHTHTLTNIYKISVIHNFNIYL